jgi:hypothetical protein
MNWEYRLVPGSAGELDSSSFNGIKFFKTLKDENNNELVTTETTPLDFGENADESVKNSYLEVCKEVFSLHLANSLTPQEDGTLPYQLDHAFGSLLYLARSNYKIITGQVN